VRVLLDTHVWLWYLLGGEQLSSTHRKIIDDPESEIWLSPISLWETSLLIERGRLSVNDTAESWTTKALKNFSVRHAVLNFDIARMARKLSGLHEDPADRFIAATAAVMGLTLLTSDARLLKGNGYLVSA